MLALERQLLAAASTGDVVTVRRLVEMGLSSSASRLALDAPDSRAWTPLMLACRGGHVEVVDALLASRRVNPALTNDSGMTARTIAAFWGHVDVDKLFDKYGHHHATPSASTTSAATTNTNTTAATTTTTSSSTSSTSSVPPAYLPLAEHLRITAPSTPCFFGASDIDRCHLQRSDAAWLDEALQHSATRFLAFSEMRPLLKLPTANVDDEAAVQKGMRIAWLTHDEVSSYLARGATWILLGAKPLEVAAKNLPTASSDDVLLPASAAAGASPASDVLAAVEASSSSSSSTVDQSPLVTIAALTSPSTAGAASASRPASPSTQTVPKKRKPVFSTSVKRVLFAIDVSSIQATTTTTTTTTGNGSRPASRPSSQPPSPGPGSSAATTPLASAGAARPLAATAAAPLRNLETPLVQEFQRMRPASFLLSPGDAALVGQAAAVIDWHARHKFCAACGSATQPAEAGYKRKCSNVECLSQSGVHNFAYPRVDPVVIMLVLSPDRKKVLLGRQKSFPPTVYSCLSGFMEVGETIETAVRREIYEEAGILVGDVTYYTSQPFPFPSSLMIGCFAQALSTDIQLHDKELESCQWVTREQLLDALSKSTDTMPTPAQRSSSAPRSRTNSASANFRLPPPFAIAYQLAKAWAHSTQAHL
ncbi:peroxisomal NADH pyrophosphatase NUDT12 [Capsaspora owczarzaki ATCC 30864]|nr:peroxisomal NADH pyrophosphatase NUDT12 [Capsaspora owczarzaki ATCC 30864]|eukprot:XP_004363543.1 peroxisomal NADH pyrophosphatase NUDT12 [Capsaspora owczarzaki ATCC 30864]